MYENAQKEVGSALGSLNRPPQTAPTATDIPSLYQIIESREKLNEIFRKQIFDLDGFIGRLMGDRHRFIKDVEADQKPVTDGPLVEIRTLDEETHRQLKLMQAMIDKLSTIA